MIVVALLIIPLFLITTTTQTKNDGSHNLSKEIPLVPIKKYNTISIDQEQLDLNHEVIQYKIILHKDDTVNVSLNMIVQQTGIDFEPMYSFIMITDGNKSIFKNSTLFYTMDVPVGSIIDTNLFGKRICIGGKLFNRLLMKTRAHIGSACYYTENIKVKNNTIWYLTIAQFDNAHKEILTIAIKSKNKEMEIVEIERNKNMNFYSSYDNDFEGRYFGFRLLPYLPFGFSIAKNLKKEVTTTKGSIICFSSMFHRKAQLSMEIENETFTNANTRYATCVYCGNQTGTWKFSASGIGFPWKHLVYLFYIDIDPHFRYAYSE